MRDKFTTRPEAANSLQEASYSIRAASSPLRKLLLATERHVPVYRDFWHKAGCQIAQMSFPNDFAQLPIISKSDFLAVPSSLRLDDRYNPALLSRESTSGSTGEPFTMHFRVGTWLKRRIRFMRALMNCGYIPGRSLMLISSRHSVSAMRLARWHYVGLDRGEAELWTKYQYVKPSTLYGPLSSLLLLAQQAIAHGPGFHCPRLIVSTAEQLTAATRAHLEQVFGADVTDFYGSTELGLVAWRGSAALHYQQATDLVMEFIPVKFDSSLERLVVTDMASGPMPLIRFDTGDLVRRNTNLTSAPINEFVGREVDCLITPGNTRISPYQITTALEEIKELERYEVIQRIDYGVDVIFWSRVTDTAALARRVQEKVAYICGHQIRVSATHSCEQLKLTGRKTRPVRSEIRPS